MPVRVLVFLQGQVSPRINVVWEPDPMIWDDQNVIVNVKDRGLVIVSGCSHAGAVNVLRNAQRLTGEKRIRGFVGGCHLTGGIFEPIIEPVDDDIVDADFEDLGENKRK